MFSVLDFWLAIVGNNISGIRKVSLFIVGQSNMLPTETEKDESPRRHETVTIFTPELFQSSTLVKSHSRPCDGTERGRPNGCVRHRAVSLQGGQGERKVAKPLVATLLSLCNHRHQQAPSLRPAGPAAASPDARPQTV